MVAAPGSTSRRRPGIRAAHFDVISSTPWNPQFVGKFTRRTVAASTAGERGSNRHQGSCCDTRLGGFPAQFFVFPKNTPELRNEYEMTQAERASHSRCVTAECFSYEIGDRRIGIH